jgi:hypothetical protein
MVLRTYDVTQIAFDAEPLRRFQDFAVANDARSLYAYIGKPAACFVAEVGYLRPDGAFFPLARSLPIWTPRTDQPGVAPGRWMTVGWNEQRDAGTVVPLVTTAPVDVAVDATAGPVVIRPAASSGWTVAFGSATRQLEPGARQARGSDVGHRQLMAAERGLLALVLQAHLPWVRHPEYESFLEEDWLFEAITKPIAPFPLSSSADDVPAASPSRSRRRSSTCSPTRCCRLATSAISKAGSHSRSTRSSAPVTIRPFSPWHSTTSPRSPRPVPPTSSAIAGI